MSGFRLSSEEVAREIHHILKESYPQKDIDGNLVFDCISSEEKSKIVFYIKKLSDKLDLSVSDVSEKLKIGIEIELEKNLHDKVLFEYTLQDDILVFVELEKI